MRHPDFDELVGNDMDAEERDRLERVHELLLAAGPPPDAASMRPVELRPRRRRGAVLAIAAALAVAAFALGAALDQRDVDFVVTMDGVGATADASVSLKVFELDSAGNWPMEVEARGLQPTTSGRPYEVWLTRNGKLAALCGSFLTDDDGRAVVPMNAPYRFSEFDGWVVVEEGSETALLST
jgi:hypothetical protein